MHPALHLQIEPHWDEIENVREKSLEFLQQKALSSHIMDAVTMVICELVENAVKYGHFNGSQKILIALTLNSESITVEVTSPIGAGEENHLYRLDRMLQWIRGHQDPFEAYLHRLKEVSSQKLDHEESGLGLVRIAYEGQSILDFFVDENNLVSVSAVYKL